MTDDRRSLQSELDELERTDPKVRVASESLDRMSEEIRDRNRPDLQAIRDWVDQHRDSRVDAWTQPGMTLTLTAARELLSLVGRLEQRIQELEDERVKARNDPTFYMKPGAGFRPQFEDEELEL